MSQEHLRTRLCAIFGGLLVGLTSCASASEVDRLDARVDSLGAEREALRSKMTEDVGKLERLHKMLTEAEETLRKSGADLGIRLARIE